MVVARPGVGRVPTDVIAEDANHDLTALRLGSQLSWKNWLGTQMHIDTTTGHGTDEY